jgi:hypothetical protein
MVAMMMVVMAFFMVTVVVLVPAAAFVVHGLKQLMGELVNGFFDVSGGGCCVCAGRG